MNQRPHTRLTSQQITLSLILLAVLFLPLLGVYGLNQTSDTAIVVNPPTGSYAVGETIAVEVWVEDVVDLYGVDIRLAFDATRLQVLDADPNLPGVQVTPRSDILSPDFVIRREADNVAGTVWYAATQINPSPPASGSGALFSFTFMTIAEGLTNVTVTTYQLADANGLSIPAQASGAVYQIGDGATATPTETSTATPPHTATATATPTITATPTMGTMTATSTATPTATPSTTPTATPSSTPTATPSSTPTATSQPPIETALRVLPAAGSYVVGETILVEVWLEDVVDLYAVDVRLAFPPALLQVQDANPALPGIQVIPRSDLLSPDFIVRREADNEAGSVWYAVTQVNPREPVSGSGALFAFSFASVAEGTAVVTVSDTTLATLDGQVIPADPFGAVYELTVGADYKLFLPVVQRN
ncbi:MAG: hypothetical protein IPM39_12535 [Chloroflexi bacterium]|nr:hypothetical protein [Chloroflexota bacterium]